MMITELDGELKDLLLIDGEDGVPSDEDESKAAFEIRRMTV